MYVQLLRISFFLYLTSNPAHNVVDNLLKKVSFNRDGGDHLIFTGDMINKGPASLDVVDFARANSASCVRGNHEDKVLLIRRAIIAGGKMDETMKLPGGNDIEGVYTRERALAKQLNNEQAEWLEKCPVILNIGQIYGMGHVVVVHGGLVPGISHERQDPLGVMTMRTIDLDNHFPNSSSEGVPWSKVSFFPSICSEIFTAIPAPQSRVKINVYLFDVAVQ